MELSCLLEIRGVLQLVRPVLKLVARISHLRQVVVHLLLPADALGFPHPASARTVGSQASDASGSAGSAGRFPARFPTYLRDENVS